MPSSDPIFRNLLSEGWFVSVVDTHEGLVTVKCLMFSRDYDEETGYTDIVFGDTEVAPGSLYCVAKFSGMFELRSHGPAAFLGNVRAPVGGTSEMPEEMGNAIAALITPENFPEVAEYMRLLMEDAYPEDEDAYPEDEDAYPEDEDARLAFWASINQQVSSMTAVGDPWGALKLQREAANKLIGWVDPPAEHEEDTVPEPNLEDMTPPRYSLIEAADAEDHAEDEEDEDNYLPVGAHLLPSEFQDFLRNWNQTIAADGGDWLGEPRKTYMKQNPLPWKEFKAELKRLSALYPTELAALKAYQASPEGKEAAGV